MNPVAKAAWVEELRSGRWQQISGAFCNSGNGRCIAGVLCEAYKRLSGRGQFVLNERLTEMNKRDSYSFESGNTVKIWAGVEAVGSRSVMYEGERIDVSILSDIGVPFDILAGLIEMQL